jgi:hypothetical protein
LHKKPGHNRTGVLMGREKPPSNESRGYAALRRLPRLVQCTAPTGDDGPRRGIVAAL